MKATLTLPITVKALDEAGTFEAMAWPYGAPDRTGDVILPGAFSKSLEGYAERQTMPPMLWQHKHDEPVGYWMELEDTDAGLRAKGRIETTIQKGGEAYKLAKNKGLSLSVGFSMKSDDAYEDDGIRYIKNLELLEVSLVSVPANAGATIQTVKSLKECTPTEFETRVRDALGLSRRQAKKLTGLAYTAMTQRDVDEMGDDIEQSIINALKSATQRIRG